MLVTAYMDESGTHNSGVTTLTALAANADQWDRLQKKVTALFSEYKLRRPYHSKELWDSDHDFKGWKINEKIKFHDELSDIINRNVEVGCVVVLKDKEYNEYYRTGNKANVSYESRYCLCFRAAFDFLLNRVVRRLVSDAWPPVEKSVAHSS